MKKLLIILLLLCGTSHAFTLKKIYPIGGDDPQKYLFTLSDTLQYNFQAIEQGQTMPLVLLTTAQKNALHAEAGLVLFDTTLNKISSYNGSTWESGLTSSSLDTALGTFEITSRKNVANGYAGLDANTRVTTAETYAFYENHYAALASEVDSGADITEASRVSFTVSSTGTYIIHGQAQCSIGTQPGECRVWIKTGSATYGSASYKGNNRTSVAITGDWTGVSTSAIVALTNGDTVHLGIEVSGSGGTRSIAGDNTGASWVGSTSLSAVRIQ